METPAPPVETSAPPSETSGASINYVQIEYSTILSARNWSANALVIFDPAFEIDCFAWPCQGSGYVLHTISGPLVVSKSIVRGLHLSEKREYFDKQHAHILNVIGTYPCHVDIESHRHT